MTKGLRLVGAVAACLLGPACTPTPTGGRITITSQIDFSSEPFRGTFEVTEGADILGCTRGSFIDTPGTTNIYKAMTCESGSRSGSFTGQFNPQDIPGPGDDNGPWSFIEATEDFSGLSGGGDFWVVYDEGGLSGVETLTGDVQFGR